MKSLVVEDEFTSRLLLQQIMKSYGSVDLAVNGKEAVAAVYAALEADEPYDLICLDIMMPEMTGQEALLQIRSLEQSKDIASYKGAKIIMTSALDDMENIRNAFDGLCDGYLVKPVQKSKLLEILETLKLLS